MKSTVHLPKHGLSTPVPILSKFVVDGIRVIVIILERSAMNQLLERVTNTITDLLDPPTTHLASTILDLQQTTDNL